MNDLPAHLPPGRLIVPSTAWLSDDGWDPDLHRRLLAEFPASGWYPVIYGGRAAEVLEEYGLNPPSLEAIDQREPAAILAELWAENVDDNSEYGFGLDHMAPFGAAWPGLAPSLDTAGIDQVVDGYLAGMGSRPGDRLLLARVERGVDVPAAIGWTADVDLARVVAVLRSWEARFGARLIYLGFDGLTVVTMPTDDTTQLQLMAAEQWAFNSDWINQETDTLEAQVQTMHNDPEWYFWWD